MCFVTPLHTSATQLDGLEVIPGDLPERSRLKFLWASPKFSHAQGLRVQGFSFAQRWQHLVAWWQKAAGGDGGRGGCGCEMSRFVGKKAEDLYVGILP